MTKIMFETSSCQTKIQILTNPIIKDRNGDARILDCSTTPSVIVIKPRLPSLIDSLDNWFLFSLEWFYTYQFIPKTDICRCVDVIVNWFKSIHSDGGAADFRLRRHFSSASLSYQYGTVLLKLAPLVPTFSLNDYMYLFLVGLILSDQLKLKQIINSNDLNNHELSSQVIVSIHPWHLVGFHHVAYYNITPYQGLSGDTSKLRSI